MAPRRSLRSRPWCRSPAFRSPRQPLRTASNACTQASRPASSVVFDQGCSNARLGVPRTVSPAVATTAPLACRPTSPVSKRSVPPPTCNSSVSAPSWIRARVWMRLPPPWSPFLPRGRDARPEHARCNRISTPPPRLRMAIFVPRPFPIFLSFTTRSSRGSKPGT